MITCIKPGATVGAPTKTCRECGEVKTVDHYNRHPSGKYGVSTICRTCQSAYHRRRRRDRHSQTENNLGDKALDGKALVSAPSNGCAVCQYSANCRSRVQAGAWVLCEIPDKADKRRAATLEYINA